MKEVCKVCDYLNKNALTSDDARLIFREISPFLYEGFKIVLDFKNIDEISSRFLTTLLIDLYDFLGEDVVDSHLSYRNIPKSFDSNLSLCKRNIKAFTGDKVHYIQTLNKVLTYSC